MALKCRCLWMTFILHQNYCPQLQFCIDAADVSPPKTFCSSTKITVGCHQQSRWLRPCAQEQDGDFFFFLNGQFSEPLSKNKPSHRRSRLQKCQRADGPAENDCNHSRASCGAVGLLSERREEDLERAQWRSATPEPGFWALKTKENFNVYMKPGFV